MTSSKTEFLNANKEVQETEAEAVNISFDKSFLTILINVGSEDKMTGEIKSTSCNWKLPYMEDQLLCWYYYQLQEAIKKMLLLPWKEKRQSFNVAGNRRDARQENTVTGG